MFHTVFDNVHVRIAMCLYIMVMTYILYFQISTCRKQIESFTYEPMYIEYVIDISQSPYTLKIPVSLNVSKIQERLTMYKTIVETHVNDPMYYIVNLTTNTLIPSIIFVIQDKNTFFQRCLVFDENDVKDNMNDFVRTNKKNNVICSQGIVSLLKPSDPSGETGDDNRKLMLNDILNGYNPEHHEGIILICNIDVVSLLDLYITDLFRIKNYSKIIAYTENPSELSLENLRYIRMLSGFEETETQSIRTIPSLWVFEKQDKH